MRETMEAAWQDGSQAVPESPASNQAQQIAGKTGAGCQTVVKQAIGEGLKRAG